MTFTELLRNVGLFGAAVMCCLIALSVFPQTWKVLWAPIIDRVDAPIFGRFGRRRGWMLISQLLVALALFGLEVASRKASA